MGAKAQPTACTWCEGAFMAPLLGTEPRPKRITIQMTTSHGPNRLTYNPVYLCSTGCLVEWAKNLDIENPDWWRTVAV